MTTDTEIHKPTVRIHIDREVYESPNPTTGAALYRLGQLPEHRALFREGDAHREDQLIERDHEAVHLVAEERFYSQKEITLIVNAEAKAWTDTTISFEQITHLAFPDPPPPGIIIRYTVEYSNGTHRKPEGSLTKGGVVPVKNGMIFNVTETGRS